MSGIINFAEPLAGSFLVKIIIWLVKTSSSIAAGIIIFTLILKLITLPFDFISRASMRKNSLKMEEMRPELERLQKQYADNKELYNQKMMALYKKNGYSMFGACLPTILTLVIFIVAINAFTNYSQYQNKLDFYNMSKAYNNVIYYGIEPDDEYIIRNEDGSVTIDSKKLYNLVKENKNVEVDVPNTNITVKWESNTTNKLVIVTDNSYVTVKQNFDIINNNEENPVFTSCDFVVSSIKNDTLKCEQNNNLLNSEGKTFEQAKQANSELTVDAFINDIQSLMSAKTYRENQSSFLWIKNIWVTDSPTKNPIESNWETFKTTHKYGGETSEDIGQDNYDRLIKHLEEEKTAPNGYFILVALTAGLSFLSQIVMSKSQKAQMELQTVDGQGAQTQKMMTWMMPIMMAIFAFMYTSAFSIYIILSTLISMVSTFGINFVVDRKFKKEKDANKTDVIRGRVYNQKQEEKVKEEKKEKSVPEKGDFLSGTADGKKHIRGRIK